MDGSASFALLTLASQLLMGCFATFAAEQISGTTSLAYGPLFALLVGLRGLARNRNEHLSLKTNLIVQQKSVLCWQLCRRS
jgi:hypothetical protein